MEWITNFDIWIALATLTALEIVLGIDNIIFLSILVAKLPEKQRKSARMIGLSLAMIIRIILLLCLSWVMGLVEPIVTIFSQTISGRDLILILGGLFLLVKSTHEIHNSLEGEEVSQANQVHASFAMILLQIALLDMVFSLDSVITAVGLVDQVPVMIAAIIISIIVMILAAKSISEFIEQHPTLKILALSFLILVGVTLIADGFDQHIPRGYIYFSMAFSVFVEMLNIKMRAKRAVRPIKLRKKMST